jgi:nucleotide-binding universal stress UspA family protein
MTVELASKSRAIELGRQEDLMFSPSSLSTSNHILVPLDHSACSQKALSYALSLSKQFKVSLLIHHVVELFPVDYCFGVQSVIEEKRWQFEEAQTWLTNISGQCGGPGGTGIKSMVTYGMPFREIVRVAKAQHVYLIIISTHGYTGFKHLQHGSTAERVVRNAPCPVLVVRQHEHEFGGADKMTDRKCV